MLKRPVERESSHPLPPRVRATLEQVAAEYRCTVSDLLSYTVDPHTNSARFAAYQELHRIGFSRGQIGYWMGRDPYTVGRGMRQERRAS
jgi:hypothetical protein